MTPPPKGGASACPVCSALPPFPFAAGVVRPAPPGPPVRPPIGRGRRIVWSPGHSGSLAGVVLRSPLLHGPVRNPLGPVCRPPDVCTTHRVGTCAADRTSPWAGSVDRRGLGSGSTAPRSPADRSQTVRRKKGWVGEMVGGPWPMCPLGGQGHGWGSTP